jgi:hypothetical protein
LCAIYKKGLPSRRLFFYHQASLYQTVSDVGGRDKYNLDLLFPADGIITTRRIGRIGNTVNFVAVDEE